jgi:hypothetical protein
MKIDIYTKIVLTVIGVALCVIAWQGASPRTEAVAQSAGCGNSSHFPCHVEVDFADSLKGGGTIFEALRITQ